MCSVIDSRFENTSIHKTESHLNAYSSFTEITYVVLYKMCIFCKNNKLYIDRTNDWHSVIDSCVRKTHEQEWDPFQWRLNWWDDWFDWLVDFFLGDKCHDGWKSNGQTSRILQSHRNRRESYHHSKPNTLLPWVSGVAALSGLLSRACF